MFKPLAVSLALLASAPALAAGELQVSKIIGTATINQSGKNKPAEVKLMLRTGDVLTAGPQSRAGLSFGKTGELVLAGLSELQVYEASPGTRQTPALAKLKLLAGAIKINSSGKPAQDVRLNVGLLKTRIFDAEVWGASTTEGDTVCLIRGAVEIQSAGTEAPTRLTTEGNCLRREPDGKTLNIKASSDEILPAAIAATAFAPEAGIPPPRPAASVIASKAPEPMAVAVPTPVALPEAEPALPTEATIQAPAVMVPSAPKAGAASQRAVADASAMPTVTARAQGQVLIQTPVQTIVQSAPIIETPDPATKAKMKAEIAAKPVVKVLPGQSAVVPRVAAAAQPVAASNAASIPAAAASSAAASTGRWTVVVMSSPNQVNVQARTQVMQDQGFIANLRQAEVNGQTYYRVTIGEFASRDEAAAYAKHTLAKSGIAGWLSPI
jgi:septal ring-binding cell division protein DamX